MHVDECTATVKQKFMASCKVYINLAREGVHYGLTNGGWLPVTHFGLELLQKGRLVRFSEGYISTWDGHPPSTNAMSWVRPANLVVFNITFSSI